MFIFAAEAYELGAVVALDRFFEDTSALVAFELAKLV